jgi:hypothetical protein
MSVAGVSEVANGIAKSRPQGGEPLCTKEKGDDRNDDNKVHRLEEFGNHFYPLVVDSRAIGKEVGLRRFSADALTVRANHHERRTAVTERGPAAEPILQPVDLEKESAVHLLREALQERGAPLFRGDLIAMSSKSRCGRCGFLVRNSSRS